MRPFCLRVTSKSNDWRPYEKRRDTRRQKEHFHGRMRHGWQYALTSQGVPSNTATAGTKRQEGPPWCLQGEQGPETPSSRLLASRAVGRRLWCLSPVCGALFRLPQETRTPPTLAKEEKGRKCRGRALGCRVLGVVPVSFHLPPHSRHLGCFLQWG